MCAKVCGKAEPVRGVGLSSVDASRRSTAYFRGSDNFGDGTDSTISTAYPSAYGTASSSANAESSAPPLDSSVASVEMHQTLTGSHTGAVEENKGARFMASPPAITSVPEVPKEPEPPPRLTEPPPGCYLEYAEKDQGTILMHWSEVPLEGALAVFYPEKPAPKHKFKTNQGRIELFRSANLGVHKQRYFDGVCCFVKTARSMEATLIVWTDLFQVVLHKPDDSVTIVQVVEASDFQPDSGFEVSDIDAVAVVSNGNLGFKGIHTMPQTNFVQTGVKEGHAVNF